MGGQSASKSPPSSASNVAFTSKPSPSITFSHSAVAKGGTESTSFCSSYTATGGNTSGRELSTCPSFTNVGPSAVSVSRSSTDSCSW